MSRSNGPLNQGRGAPPQHWQLPEEEEVPAPHGFQLQPQPQAGRYPQQPVYQPAADTTRQPQYQPANAPKYAPQPENTAQQQAYYAQPQQPAYQPQFDRYSPEQSAQRPYDARALQQLQQRPAQSQPVTPQPGQPSLYDTHMAQINAQTLQAQALQAQQAQAAAQAAQTPLPRGAIYDQWPGANIPRHSASAGQAGPAQQPRDYDFSNYARTGAGQQQPQEFSRAASPPLSEPNSLGSQFQVRQPTTPAQPADQWQLKAGYDRRTEAGHVPNEYANQQENYEPLGDEEHRNALQAAGEQGFDQDDQLDFEEEEPRKGRRGLVMVSALVGAIALGGGMAYGYKTYMKPSASSAVIGKVSAPKGPAKTAPAEAGGKQFPNQDSKLAGRLGDGSAPAVQVAEAPPAGPSAPPSNNAPDLEGVKRVPTVVVGRDGSIGAPAPVPGMMIQQTPIRPPQPALQVPVTESAPPPVVPRARVADVPMPRAAAAIVNTVTPEPAPVAAPAVKKSAAKKSAAQRDDLVASGTPSSGVGAAPVPVAPKSVASGFVAVVASKGSRADAEKANVDLEQRFDVLKGKVFDVQEADLTAQGKGMVYRSVVGPPGSRAFASGVCSQLKAVGYTDCWPTAY